MKNIIANVVRNNNALKTLVYIVTLIWLLANVLPMSTTTPLTFDESYNLHSIENLARDGFYGTELYNSTRLFDANISLGLPLLSQAHS